jgi:hypothetical protein
MKKYLLITTILLAAQLQAQIPDNNFINPRPVSYTTAIAEDTMNNCVYLANYYPQGFHNEWQLHKVDLSTNTGNMIIASGVGAGYKTQKMIFKNNVLYLLHERTRITALDLNTLTYLWSCAVNDPNWERINDFDIKNDTLFIAGDFAMVNASSRSSLAAISSVTGAVLPWDPSFGGTRNYSVLKTIRCHNNRVYVGGKFNVLGRINLGGIDIASANVINWWPNPNDTVIDMEITGGKMFLGGYFTTIGSNQPRQHLAQYLMSTLGLQVFSVPTNNYVSQVELNSGTGFIGGAFTQIGSSPRLNLGSVDLSLNSTTSWNPSGQPAGVSLTRIRNRLYVCSETNVYLKVYCLAPGGSNPIIGPTAICAGQDSVLYAVAPSLYAATYQWNYSGSGCILQTNGNSALLSFATNATPGVLSVIPISNCGSQGNIQTINILINQPPNVNAGPDQTLTCFLPQINLIGSSTSANTNYDWQGPQNCNACQNISITLPGLYFLTVTDTINGCFSVDTCLVTIDTIRPVPIPPNPVPLITCSQSSILLDGSAGGNAIIWWKSFPGNVIINDSSYINQIGYYYLFAQNSINGCVDSVIVLINENRSQPNSTLLSHPDIFPAEADTLTCFLDSIMLLGSSDSVNVNFSWKKIQTGINYLNPFYLTSPGYYRFFVSRNDNGCVDSSLIVNIAQDTNPPVLFPMSNLPDLTCSNDSVTLLGQSLNTNTLIWWTGPNNFYSSNPAYATAPGTYEIFVQNNLNGCVRNDSVTINYLPLITIELGNDSIKCEQSSIQVVPDINGSFTSLTYQWMNGSTEDTLQLFFLSDTVVWVAVADSSGCYGTDTLLLHPAPQILDSTLSFLACNGNPDANFQIQVYQGLGPFEYRIDSLWLRSNQFGPLPFGWYHYQVRDRIGCITSDSVLLSSSTQAPELRFMVSSLNQSGDSLVIKDISNPAPDSINWIFPNEITWLTGTCFEPLIYSNDTGTFAIQGTAHFNDCEDELIKTVYFGPQLSFDSVPVIDITTYPNPASTVCNLTLDLACPQHFSILLLDMNGIQLWNTGGYGFHYTGTLNLNAFANGIYRIWVIGEFGEGSIMLIKQP